MSSRDEVLARIDRIEAWLRERRTGREREFERWKRHYGGPAMDPNAWIRHLPEIGRAVDAAVPAVLPPAVLDDFTSVADAFLAGSPTEREAWTAHAAACEALSSGYDIWYVVVRGRIGQTRDALWLRRALAVSALVCGGRDFRDEQLSLDGLAAVARDAGIDAAHEFRAVAELASDVRKFGFAASSVRRFLQMRADALR